MIWSNGKRPHHQTPYPDGRSGDGGGSALNDGETPGAPASNTYQEGGNGGANTGSGGGGSGISTAKGGNGASGIVMIRYKFQ